MQPTTTETLDKLAPELDELEPGEFAFFMAGPDELTGLYRLALVTEDVPGYLPISLEIVNFETSDEAIQESERINERLGLSRDRAAEIIWSSMVQGSC